MKGKLLITVIVGLLFFSPNILWAGPGGIPDCANSLNICTTNLGACTNNLNMYTMNLEVCTTNLTNAQTNLGVCTTSLAEAQTNMASAQTNLATCQETVAKCNQKTSFPSWDKKLACDSTSNCPRFEVLADWDNAAVLDRETGLVWEESPDDNMRTWYNSQFGCTDSSIGGRSGWRLPTVEELKSLVDKTQPNPALPAGHPFKQVQSSGYWSATNSFTYNGYVWNMWLVDFANGDGYHGAKDELHFRWCVRGGQRWGGESRF